MKRGVVGPVHDESDQLDGVSVGERDTRRQKRLSTRIRRKAPLGEPDRRRRQAGGTVLRIDQVRSMLRRDLDPGTFPEILADYRSIGFDVYTRLLSGIGARFFIVRKPAFTIVGEVDPVDFDLITDGRRRGPLNELSPPGRATSQPSRAFRAS